MAIQMSEDNEDRGRALYRINELVKQYARRERNAENTVLLIDCVLADIKHEV